MMAAYIISRKSEVLECFKNYKMVDESQHGNKVDQIRCYQRRDYVSRNDFCAAEGVFINFP